MPPDPQSQAVIDSLPPFDLARVQPHQLRAMERASVPPLELERAHIASVVDDAIAGPAGTIPIRIYTPRAEHPAAPRPPVLLYFHGGGHTAGSLDGYDGLCCQFARHTGYILVAVDYRLAPENKFPAAAEDCYAATLWAASHAQDFGADPACIAVAGDSAGGNLAAVTCLMARDRGGPAIGVQVLIYPNTTVDGNLPSRTRNGSGYFLTAPVIDWFLNHYVSTEADRRNPYLAPLKAATHANLPPALVITAEYDPLLDDGREYASALQAAGVPTTYVCYPETIHGFVGFYQAIDKGREAIEYIGAYLRKKGQGALPPTLKGVYPLS